MRFRALPPVGSVVFTEPGQKRAKLNRPIDALYPGRSDILRPMTESEERQTAVLSLRIEEASARIRDQGRVDDEDDYGLPIWSGTIPMRMQLLEAVPDPRNIEGLDTPAHFRGFKLG